MTSYQIAYDIVQRVSNRQRRSILGVMRRTFTSASLTTRERNRISTYEEVFDVDIADYTDGEGEEDIRSVVEQLLQASKEDGTHPLNGAYGQEVTAGSVSELFPKTWKYLSNVVLITHPELEEAPDVSVNCGVRDTVAAWIQGDTTFAFQGDSEIYVYWKAPKDAGVPLDDYVEGKRQQYDTQPKYVKRLVHEYQHVLQNTGLFSQKTALPKTIGRSASLGHRLISFFLFIPGVSSLVSDAAMQRLNKAAKRTYFQSPIEYEARLAEYVYLRVKGKGQQESFELLDVDITPKDVEHRLRELETKVQRGEATSETKSSIEFLEAVREDLEDFVTYGEELVSRVRRDRDDLWDISVYEQTQ